MEADVFKKKLRDLAFEPEKIWREKIDRAFGKKPLIKDCAEVSTRPLLKLAAVVADKVLLESDLNTPKKN